MGVLPPNPIPHITANNIAVTRLSAPAKTSSDSPCRMIRNGTINRLFAASPISPPASCATNAMTTMTGTTDAAPASSSPTPLASRSCKNRCADIAPTEKLVSMCVMEIDQNARVRNASRGVKL